MLHKKKLRSLRPMVFLIVGIILAVFIVFFFSIAQNTMSRILLQAESNYVNDRLAVVSGNLASAHENLELITKDVAHWEEMVRYTKGENPGFIENNWTGGTMLQYYRYNFIIVKDREGNDLHVEFYDLYEDKPMEIPADFVAALGNICGEVLADYEAMQPQDEWDERIGRSGILFFEGTAYDICVRPAVVVGDGQAPGGTVAFGNVLNSEYFRTLTHYADADFELINSSDEASINQSRIDRLSGSTLTASMPMRDIRGNRILLKLNAPRTLYLEGRDIIGGTTTLMLVVVAVFIAVLYLFIVRLVLRPIERLSADIEHLSGTDTVDTKKYTSSREFHTLGSAINELVERLNQSNISLGAFLGILNGMDAYLYVTDPETDEILFINDRMKEHFGLGDAADHKICWQVLQAGQSGRCDFCPMHRLEREPNGTVEWEEKSTVTGRYYKNTDRMIEWTNGRMVHLQHSIDITESITSQSTLQRRLEQQQLMSAISQSFISTTDADVFILSTLEKTGAFMAADKIVVVCVDPAAGMMTYRHGWHNRDERVPELQVSAIPFQPGHPIYDAFMVRGQSHIACDDTAGEPAFAFLAGFGIKSFLTVPIYVSGALWGTITVDYCIAPHAWSESDIHLVGLIVNVISGVITRGETEQKLIRMSSIVEGSPQYVSFIDAEGNFEYVNPGAATISGYSVEELMAGGIGILFDEATNAQVKNEILPAALEAERIVFELPLVRKDGETRLLEFSVFHTAANAGLGTIALDVTEKRQLEFDLIAAKELAEQSNHAKSDFLSRMSHEMRTPMNAIIGMTGIAKSSDDPGRKEYCLDKIDDASKHLLGVINDILDMSKIEAGKFELSNTDFNFEKMLLKVVNVINFRVDEKEQTLIIKVDPGMPDAIVADDQRLSQVITNLLSNAVKFTPNGGTITLSARLLEETDGLCTLRIDVTDTGIGVSEEQKGKLFRSFEQADGSVSRKFGGTGLGLAISKNIVGMMDGEIWVESEPGQGSSFIFTIKARRGKAVNPQSQLIRSIDWASLRILAVDDSPDVREYFRNLSETLGTHCAVAADGYEAVRLIEESGDKPFHIAFVDWKMPGMNGIELTKRIKGNAGHADEAVDTVVIMISAAEWDEIEPEAKQAGVDRFVPKPLFSSLIVDCVNECLSADESLSTVETAEDSDTGRFAGYRILLAEDIEINREIVTAMLEHTGIAIDCAENGRAACEMFAAAPAAYDMIFMDIHMPEVDGYEATRLIRAMDLPEARTIPIVAMTANVFREDIERCLAAGMNDHVGKPIDIAEVIQKLALHLPAR